MEHHRCLRLVVSVCFLATGSNRLMGPDVVSKDLAAYVGVQSRDDRQWVPEPTLRRGHRTSGRSVKPDSRRENQRNNWNSTQ